MVIQVRKIFKCHSSFPSQYFRNQWICRSLPHYCFSFLAEQEEQGVSTSVSTTARLFFSKVKCQHKDFCDTRTSSTIFMIHEVFLGPHNIQTDFQTFLEFWQHGAMTASLGSLFHALVKLLALTPSLTTPFTAPHHSLGSYYWSPDRGDITHTWPVWDLLCYPKYTVKNEVRIC